MGRTAQRSTSLSRPPDNHSLIREYTRVRPAPFVPEFRLHLAEELVPLWQATEWRAAAPQPPPFWAFVWPGSQALARYLLEDADIVKGKRVLDFGAGSGLAAIAAAHCGASHVVACDLDPLAAAVQLLNAELNGVTVETCTGDAVDSNWRPDVVLAGDVCYERENSAATIAWLRQAADKQALVLIADPGRHYAPSDGLELRATYEVPTLQELESTTTKRTVLYRLEPRGAGRSPVR